MKTCPYCAEEIQEAAIKCRYCGEFLEQRPIPETTISSPTFQKPNAKEAKHSWPKVPAWVLLYFAGILFVLLGLLVVVNAGLNREQLNTGSNLELPRMDDEAIRTVAKYLSDVKLSPFHPRGLRTMENPNGDGTFVYHPRTDFSGITRNLIWLVLDGKAYPLNGSSKNLTPNLPWPREVTPSRWNRTGLNPLSPSGAIDIVFNGKSVPKQASTFTDEQAKQRSEELQDMLEGNETGSASR